MNVADYATMVFDCDGVVLDSNRIKTEAFRTAARPYGKAAADALAAHHVANGGISRYAKFAHFIDHIVPTHAPGQAGPDITEMLETFASQVYKGLSHCDVAEGTGRPAQGDAP